jgi:hypothetical protein
MCAFSNLSNNVLVVVAAFPNLGDLSYRSSDEKCDDPSSSNHFFLLFFLLQDKINQTARKKKWKRKEMDDEGDDDSRVNITALNRIVHRLPAHIPRAHFDFNYSTLSSEFSCCKVFAITLYH